MAESAVPTRFLPAIAALAAGQSNAKAAAAAGVSDRTLRGWKTDPRFQVELDRVRSEACDRVMDAVVSSGESALRALKAIQNDGEAPATARVAAAGHILKLVQGVWAANDLNRAMATVQKYGYTVVPEHELTDQKTDALGDTYDNPTPLPWEPQNHDPD